MKSIKLFFLFSLLMAGIQTVSAQNVRGFYLTGIHTWLGNTIKENEILSYAEGNGFNYLSLYDLNSIDWNNSSQKNDLAAFIGKARAQYGIIEVGAVVETYAFAYNNIIKYNHNRPVQHQFDVINQEFEFWIVASIMNSYCYKYLIPNGYTCDSAGAFAFGIIEFQKIDSLCQAHGMTSEIYLGWPTRGQMQAIASIADRILLHAYRPDDSDLYAYSKNRLEDIASVNAIKKVLPIFSNESVFMGPWLNSNPVNKPYQTYANDFATDNAAFRQNIDLQGYQWFHYDLMPTSIVSTSSISANGPLNFCPGGSVSLTASQGMSYLWFPGGQTSQTITVSNPGAYSVRVTDTSGVQLLSPPTIVTHSAINSTPTVLASGPLTFCPGGSVTLTSSIAPSYLWSNGATTRAISVTTSGNYYVTNGTGSCSATSNPIQVDATAVPSTPTITASGSLSICSGSLLTLTSSVANGYLWSNGETTRSIVVSTAGNYKVNAYSGPYCSSPSAVKTVTIRQSPSTPAISAGSSTILTPSHPSVILTSSSADSYRWSNGQTTRSIEAFSQGSYRVTVTSANGCSASSSPIAVKSNGCIPPAPPVIQLSGPSVIIPGQSVTLTAANQSTGYLWSNGETTKSITISSAGIYSVRSYNSGSCFSTSLPVKITMVLPRKSNQEDIALGTEKATSLSVYPNPVRTEMNVAFSLESGKNVNISLMDLTGKIIRSQDVSAIEGDNKITMDVIGLPRGLYLARLIEGDNSQVVKVFID